MYKKMFAFAGLAIAFIVGLLCLVSSFSAFSDVARDVAVEANAGSDVAYGIGYMLIGFMLIGASLAGIVLSMIFLIKNKEFKFPIIPIIVLGCAAIMLLGLDIMIMVGSGTSIANAAKRIDGDSKYDPWYGMIIFTNLVNIFTHLAISLVVAALGVFSMITFKKKKAE